MAATYQNKRTMALREHVPYRLFRKVDDKSVFHQGRGLFQQFTIDRRPKCVQANLRWIAANQNQLRGEPNRFVQHAYHIRELSNLGGGGGRRLGVRV
jgi:hypothetical protein